MRVLFFGSPAARMVVEEGRLRLLLIVTGDTLQHHPEVCSRSLIVIML